MQPARRSSTQFERHRYSTLEAELLVSPVPWHQRTCRSNRLLDVPRVRHLSTFYLFQELGYGHVRAWACANMPQQMETESLTALTAQSNSEDRARGWRPVLHRRQRGHRSYRRARSPQMAVSSRGIRMRSRSGSSCKSNSRSASIKCYNGDG